MGATILDGFLGEARILRLLKHPNIVRVDDADSMEDGRPFVVMEYVEGESLRDLQPVQPCKLGIASGWLCRNPRQAFHANRLRRAFLHRLATNRTPWGWPGRRQLASNDCFSRAAGILTPSHCCGRDALSPIAETSCAVVHMAVLPPTRTLARSTFPVAAAARRQWRRVRTVARMACAYIERITSRSSLVRRAISSASFHSRKG